MSFWRKEVIQPALDRDVESAIREQQAILSLDPANAQAHFALGTLLQIRGDTEAAIKSFSRATELSPAFAAPRISLGRIYAVEGLYDLAWKFAREAESLGDRSLVVQLERYPNVK